MDITKQLADALGAMLDMHSKVMQDANHAKSCYQAQTIKAMNTAPGEARAALDAHNSMPTERDGQQLVTRCSLPGAHTIELWAQTDARFRVQYGQQRKSNLSYDQAASEFGYAVMHAAACAGFTDT